MSLYLAQLDTLVNTLYVLSARWLQQVVRTQEVFLHFLPGTENAADLLTKNLDPTLLQKHSAALGCRGEA